MPIRLSCLAVRLTPGSVLAGYWGPLGLYRPIMDVHLVGPGGRVTSGPAQVDSASDYTVFSAYLASQLQLSPPFPRQVNFTGGGGTLASSMSFPPDGLVSLFLTDYREYYYLPSPLVGFYPPPRPGVRQRSVLGLTNVLQFFRFVLDPEPIPPMFELHPITNFPGVSGFLPRGIALTDFIRSLRTP